MNWLEKDPYYYPLYEIYGLEFIEHAGYFEHEDLDLIESLKILCTPLNHIKKPSSKKHCILVTTGAMCPIHDGHIEMMIKAKDKLISEGYEILGGYIAPDHDSHIKNKNILNNALSSSERSLLISQKICEHKQETWLSVDPWYGIFNKTDINFTIELARLELYLKKYLNLETTFCYVCGSDRAEFAEAFLLKGMCAVIERPGYKTKIPKRDNLFLIKGDNHLSSTKVRTNFKYFPEKSKVKIRKDLTKILPFYKKYFSEVILEDSIKQLKKFEELNVDNIISLDPLIRNKHHLQISREYDLFGHIKLGYFINEENSNFPKDITKAYSLYDDDIYTGGTMVFASKYLLNHGIKIDNYFSFNLSQGFEILGNRDFILFGKNNGLVIKLNDLHYRVPYIYPFVDPRIRCSILDPLQFSIDVWTFNCKELETDERTLEDFNLIDSIFQKLFDKKTKLYEICLFYKNYLEGLK